MKKTINLEFSILEVKTILNTLQSQIHSDIEFLNTGNVALNPAGETFQTFLSIINDMSEIYLKLSSAIEEDEEENND